MTGEELTEIRKALGLNKVEFGMWTGISPPTLLYYERGDNKIPKTAVMAVAAVCHGLRKRDASAEKAGNLDRKLILKNNPHKH